jgi:hypothetical protein
MSENYDRKSFLAFRLPADLRAAIERDAAMLDVSVSAAARLRLRTGRVPVMAEQTFLIAPDSAALKPFSSNKG